MSLLEIRNLTVEFETARGRFRAVSGVDLSADAGEVLSVVGESGSGKSVSMLAVMGLVAFPGRVTADVLRFDGADLLALSARQRRQLVGRDMAMIFQEPTTSLNPCFPVGWQVGEGLRAHHAVPRAKVRGRVVELFEQVGIPDAARRLNSFPHQMSGGMNQRVMIAMAIACEPRRADRRRADDRAGRHASRAQIIDLLRIVAHAPYGTGGACADHARPRRRRRDWRDRVAGPVRRARWWSLPARSTRIFDHTAPSRTPAVC